VSNPGDTIVVRQVEGEAEIDAFHRLSITVYWNNPGPELEAAVRRERSDIEGFPEFHPRQRRAAFRGDTMVGGYVMFDRWLRIGSSYLSTGCIGGVGTHPDHRLRGVASALMRDAIVHAEECEHSLILLDGIPRFYHRFGFADVVDYTEHAIDRTSVPSGAPPDIAVRPATAADVSALLAVFERHFRSYTGCFTRTTEQQDVRLRRALERGNPPVLAFDGDGHARGYLIPDRVERQARAREVAADTWPVAAALLHHHAAVLTARGDTTTDLTWPLPLDSPTLYHLCDNLGVADTSTWGNPNRGWSVRSETYHHPSAGWMGRAVSLRRSLESLRPAWHARLARALPGWVGDFVLSVGGESCAVKIADGEVEILENLSSDMPGATFAPERFVQLVFGFRSVTYAASQPGSAISSELGPVLEALFPPGHAWIPASDGF
jgi:GNAT superfamily N-acetyltransferase